MMDHKVLSYENCTLEGEQSEMLERIWSDWSGQSSCQCSVDGSTDQS